MEPGKKGIMAISNSSKSVFWDYNPVFSGISTDVVNRDCF
jgi:hypothetical protein